MEFGLTLPQKGGGLYSFERHEYVPGLHRTLDVASQGFGSIWVNDHLSIDRAYMMECWTLLTRYFPDGIQCFHKHTILRQYRL